MQSDQVHILASLEIVVFQKLFVLEVSKLGLHRVELIPQGQVVLVSLLYLENLGFKLADKKIFLVRGHVNSVVVLDKL